ncbi:M48 family metallopeptidase [Pseudomonas sp. LB3P31]
MIRLSILAIAIATICGCAQIKVPGLPLGGPKVDPNLTQYAANFSGQAANRSNIAQSSPESTQLQKKALGIAADNQIDTYLNAVLARIQKSIPGTPAAARVYATPNTEFNATSFQDGGIYVSYKMLDSLESEDELAAVIAHEYSHVLLQHYKTNWIDTVSSVAYSAGNIYINRQLKTATSNDLMRMVAANNAALGVSQIGLVPALSRDQENAADQLGADLIVRANYSYIGELNFLSRMQEWDARNRAIIEKRKTNYIDLFAKSEKNVITDAVDGQLDILENKLAKLIHDTSVHHDQGEERLTTLRTYIKKHYANADRPPLTTKPYVAVLKSAHAKDFFAGIDKVHASLAAMQEQQLPLALANAKAAEKSPAGSTPFARHAMINAMALNGKPRDAFTMLEGMVASGDALFADDVLLVGVLKGSSPEKALASAQRSYDRYNSSPELLPELILLNKQMKNQLAVVKFYGVCAGKALSAADNALLDNCNKAKG